MWCLKGTLRLFLNISPLTQECLAAFGNLVDDSRRTAANFISYSFSHVKRKGNAVANNLAKLAKHSIAPQIWLEDIHSDEYCYQSCDS